MGACHETVERDCSATGASSSASSSSSTSEQSVDLEDEKESGKEVDPIAPELKSEMETVIRDVQTRYAKMSEDFRDGQKKAENLVSWTGVGWVVVNGMLMRPMRDKAALTSHTDVERLLESCGSTARKESEGLRPLYRA